jgi:FtsZ-binding cell division protein ZapB
MDNVRKLSDAELRQLSDNELKRRHDEFGDKAQDLIFEANETDNDHIKEGKMGWARHFWDKSEACRKELERRA